jgi:long-chain fatty acid transport protein
VRKSGWFILVAAWGWLIMAPAPGYGSGFALYEAGARASALMGTMVARADDPSAIFYNPAGLVQLPGLRVLGGFSVILPHTEIVTQSGPFNDNTFANSQARVVPHFFATYKLNERVWLGLGLNSPFGLGIKYNDNWPGRFNLIKADIQTLNINPTVAVKITDYLSVGGGLDIMYFNFNLKRAFPLPFLGEQTLHLAGDTWGLGFNLGVLLRPRPDLSIGVSYRSQISQQLSGPAQVQPYYPLNTRASGGIILPDQIFAGIMVRPVEKLSVEAGVIWTRWSLFQNFNVKFDNALGFLSERKAWHNTWRGQIGVEYKALPWLDVRGGYSLENEPMPDQYVDYLVPTSNLRHNFSCGTGFRWGSATLDLAYTLVYMPARFVNSSAAPGVLPSTFQNRLSHVIVCSLGYKF